MPRSPTRSRPGGAYLEVLRIPGALGFSAAGFAGRMPMSMFGLGTVLLVAAITGRYGVAGVVAAAGSVGYAGSAPQLARLADRLGQHRVLVPQALVFAAAHGRKPLAGLWLGLYALSSAAGGLWYGSRHWHTALHRRFLLTLCCTVTGVATFWLVPDLSALAAVMLAAGLAISPTLIAGYGLIEQQAPASRRTEGMTWLSSAISVGVAAGSPAAGHLIDAYGPRWGYVFAAACGAAALLTCLAGAGWLRPVQAGASAPGPGPAPSPA